jgi:hypothetical protein
MYLLKHIYIGVNSVINHLIVALVLTTSACLFSSAYAGTLAQSPILLRGAITANNGHVNTNLFYFNIDKYNVSAGFIQPLSLHICNDLGMNVTGDCLGNSKPGWGIPNHWVNRLRITIPGGVVV